VQHDLCLTHEPPRLTPTIQRFPRRLQATRSFHFVGDVHQLPLTITVPHQAVVGTHEGTMTGLRPVSPVTDRVRFSVDHVNHIGSQVQRGNEVHLGPDLVDVRDIGNRIGLSAEDVAVPGETDGDGCDARPIGSPNHEDGGQVVPDVVSVCELASILLALVCGKGKGGPVEDGQE
jgi:hypothetical protein